MLDPSRIQGFDWDNGNIDKNLEKHDITQQQADQVFLDPRLLVLDDEKHSGEEARFHAFGETLDGRRLQISFTLRLDRTLVRVISARPMSRKERIRYEEEA